MIKKLLITVFVCLSFITLSGCGNKDIIGTTFTFKYAKIRLADGRKLFIRTATKNMNFLEVLKTNLQEKE